MSPVVARRDLLRRFVSARRRAGFTSREQAAAALGWSTRKQTVLESDEQAIPLKDLERIFLTFDVPEVEWPTWQRLAELARSRAWWDAYGDADLGAEAKRYIGLEWGARRIRSFDGTIMPALLQIPGYTRAALRSAATHLPPEQVRQLLDVRRRRLRALGPPDPLAYHVVIDEAALHRPGGDRETMRAQVLYVIDQAETRRNVTVQVVPFEAGLYPGQSGTFSLMDFDPAGEDDPGIVHVEPGFGTALFLDDRAQVYLYSRVFEHLLGVALSPEDSLQRLRMVADKLKGAT